MFNYITFPISLVAQPNPAPVGNADFVSPVSILVSISVDTEYESLRDLSCASGRVTANKSLTAADDSLCDSCGHVRLDRHQVVSTSSCSALIIP